MTISLKVSLKNRTLCVTSHGTSIHTDKWQTSSNDIECHWQIDSTGWCECYSASLTFAITVMDALDIYKECCKFQRVMYLVWLGRSKYFCVCRSMVLWKQMPLTV